MPGRVKKGISAASLIEQAERSGGAYIVFSYMKKYFITRAYRDDGSSTKKELIRGAVILHESKPKVVQTFKYNEGRGHVRLERIDTRGAGEVSTKRYRPAPKITMAQRKAGKKFRDKKSSRSSE